MGSLEPLPERREFDLGNIMTDGNGVGGGIKCVIFGSSNLFDYKLMRLQK